jgi:hypothetical protein
MTRLARLLVALAAFVVASGIGGARVATAAAADASTTAVVVIDTGSWVRAFTVDVGGGMSGLAALQRVASVTTYGFGGLGGAVCAIDGLGNEATQSSCLVGPNGAYWGYFHSAGGAGAWSYSPVGGGAFTLHGGDVDGWRFGTGQKPAASPVFCDYVSCPASPPAAASPSGGAGGSGSAPGVSGAGGDVGASGGAAGTAAGAEGSTGTSASTGGTGATDPATGSTVAADGATTTTTAPGGARDTPSSRKGSGVRVEAAGTGPGGGGTDSGSPVGVLVAVGIIALGAVAAVLLRRRTRAPG